tara:strand:+ start:326 stop:514 length:189 start_codon:yes stop_codon:yes gene_type:complete
MYEKKVSFDKIIFLIPNIDTAPSVGTDNKKDIFAASNLLNFNILAALIVIPDLLTPGIREII